MKRERERKRERGRKWERDEINLNTEHTDR